MTIREAHRRYTRHVKFSEGWRGHLRQLRFASFAMDESCLLKVVKYVELSPVRAEIERETRKYREEETE